jgi:hypothetical protein
MKSLVLFSVVLLAPVLLGCVGARCSTCGDCCEPPACYTCVPEAKPVKKVVYECKLVPYCEHKLAHIGDCDCCPKCKACPKFKQVLLKREIEVGCDWECVPKEVPCCATPHAPYCDCAAPVVHGAE